MKLLEHYNEFRHHTQKVAPFISPFRPEHPSPVCINDLSQIYYRSANAFPRISREHPNKIGVTLFWDCENIGGVNFMIFLPDLMDRIYRHFGDLDCALEFRGCYAALRETRLTRENCFALRKIQRGLENAGINVDIIPESAGSEAADLSLYGMASKCFTKKIISGVLY